MVDQVCAGELTKSILNARLTFVDVYKLQHQGVAYEVAIMFAVLKEVNCGLKSIYDEYIRFIEIFRQEWRHDKIMSTILIAMTLFNPDGLSKAFCDKFIR